MRLSTRSRYAVRAMADLALHGEYGPVPLNRVAARQQISLEYLEQLFRKLRRAGLVSSVRGPRGGFRLAKSPSEITILEIVGAVEESTAPVLCAGRRRGRKPCPRLEHCTVRLVWEELGSLIHDFFAKKTLGDLLAGTRELSGRNALCHSYEFHI